MYPSPHRLCKYEVALAVILLWISRLIAIDRVLFAAFDSEMRAYGKPCASNDDPRYAATRHSCCAESALFFFFALT